MARTIVALYDRADDARRAFDDLIGAGVPRDDISLVSTHSGDHGAGTMVGATLGGVGGAMLAMAALTIPGVGALVAIGPITAGLVGAGAGAVAGGLVGSLTGFGVPEDEVHAYAAGVERGGTLLLVHTDHAVPERITEVLSRHPPVDVRTRGDADGDKDALAGRGADWRTAAWAPFDQSAGPMEVPRPQQSTGGDPSRGVRPAVHSEGERSGADWQAVAREPDGMRPDGTRKADNTEVGQPGSSPGTRGGATAFGGIERLPEKTKPKVK